MERKKIISLQFSTGKYQAFVDSILSLAGNRQSAYVCIANVHMLIEAYVDKKFRKTVNLADIVTPDGQPLTWCMRLFYGIRQDRVAGMDLLPDLLKGMSETGMSAYFYGGMQSLLDKTAIHLSQEFPGLQVAGMYSPPFRPLTAAENEQIISMINNSGAGIIFVVLGCPKQEKWMESMKGKINAVMIGIGGALPVMVGLQKRAPRWLQNYGLEWLFRLYQEPKRLFKRYAVTNSLFVYLFFKELINIRILRKV